MGLRSILLAGVTVALAGCGENEAGQEIATRAATNTVVAKKHPTYCFFKDAETKGWRASRDRAGNVVVAGKAHVKDARYKAVISETEISGSVATLWLTISQNGGYAAPENWWDIATTMPASTAVDAVKVQCGKKVVAELSLRK